MALGWLRALPRQLRGGPGAAELYRSLCQRPARVPAQGGDTCGAETSKGDTSRCDTSRADTLRGDTSRGDTFRADTSDTSRGDTSRGDTSRCDTSRGDSCGADTFRAETSRADTSRGDTSRGDTFRGDTSKGDTLRGDTCGGDTFKAETSRGDIPGGDTFRDDTLRGDTSRSDTLRGDTCGADTSRGDIPGGDTPRCDSPGGDTSRGDTFRAETSRGDTLRGDIPGGDTPRSDTCGADTSRCDTSRGDIPGGDTPRGDTSRSDTSRSDTSKGDTPGGDTPKGDTPKPPLRHLRWYKSHRQHRGDDTTGDNTDTTGDTDDTDSATGGSAAFSAALRELQRRPAVRGGRLALLEAALAAMPALGVQRSRPAYHALLRLLPRGAWVPRGSLQRLLLPFPRQQESAVRLLECMERYGVMPDAETRFLLLGVFGPRSRPLRKVQRMLFWLPRLRHLDPHPTCPETPGLGMAMAALRRISGDLSATVSVVQPPVPESGEDEGSVQPFIVSAQSPEQRELLARHDPSLPVFVEGPFPLWLRGTLLKYFVLRGEPLPPHLRDPPPDPERSFYFPLHLELDLERGPWDQEEFDVDEVSEGPVLALCVPGSGDRLTLARWLRYLQVLNPVLGHAPVVFRLTGEGEGPRGDPPSTGLGPGGTRGALGAPEGETPGGDPEKSGE